MEPIACKPGKTGLINLTLEPLKSIKKLPGAIGEKPLQLCSGHNRRKCRETRERWLYPS